MVIQKFVRMCSELAIQRAGGAVLDSPLCMPLE
jgi:hypothetical protein